MGCYKSSGIGAKESQAGCYIAYVADICTDILDDIWPEDVQLCIYN